MYIRSVFPEPRFAPDRRPRNDKDLAGFAEPDGSFEVHGHKL